MLPRFVCFHLLPHIAKRGEDGDPHVIEESLSIHVANPSLDWDPSRIDAGAADGSAGEPVAGFRAWAAESISAKPGVAGQVDP
jgi:hypothetical protein